MVGALVGERVTTRVLLAPICFMGRRPDQGCLDVQPEIIEAQSTLQILHDSNVPDIHAGDEMRSLGIGEDIDSVAQGWKGDFEGFVFGWIGWLRVSFMQKVALPAMTTSFSVASMVNVSRAGS